ncbi:unnamed protein product [Meloidogyne enterolobii]|uniref:Uncharacterized protein n=1 Tax=Meloidogyne enterolobii TaxID=390850 RepID=A0ACB0XQE4_MELEN
MLFCWVPFCLDCCLDVEHLCKLRGLSYNFWFIFRPFLQKTFGKVFSNLKEFFWENC